MSSAPLWLTKPTLPGAAIPAANVAFSPSTGFMTPRQFGPTMRMPRRARLGEHLALQLRAVGADLAEAGRDDDRARERPCAAHSATSAGRRRGGVTMTARSTGSSIAARLG